MKKLKLLHRILRLTGIDKVVSGFIAFYFVCSFVLFLVEPTLTNYGDAMWFAFGSFTTIGYGDYLVTTLVSRLITALLALYGILVVALIPGILVSFFTEIKSIKNDETILEFLTKLENLPNLSHEELEEISKIVKKRRFKI